MRSAVLHKPLQIVSILLLLFNANASVAQTWQDTTAMIDKIVERYADNHPGAQVAVSRYGQLIYSSARGLADMEHNVPLTKTSRIEAGSISKQFTAACILLLEQQGKLSLSDDVRKYVPEVPDYGSTITLRHLMNHVSGLKDWGSVAELSGWPRGTKTYSNTDALHIISQQKTVNNKPNDEYIYSNSGYTLLTIIVGRVSGMPLAAFSKKYIFEPAGMTHTEWRDHFQKVVPERAIAYAKSGNYYHSNMPNEDAHGNGGLITTAEDLLLWNRFYLEGKLGSPSLLAKQLALTPYNNGKKSVYAAGLIVDSLSGWSYITHSGATASYRANLDHFPDLGLSIAWVSNTSQSDMSDIPSAIRNLLVKNKRPPARNTNATPTTIDFKSFQPFTGAYRETRTGEGFQVFLEEDGLYILPRTKIYPVTKTVAVNGRTRLSFKTNTLYLINGGDTSLYTSVALPDPGNLKVYAGVYISDETESKMTISYKDGKLWMEERNESKEELKPVYKHGFSFNGGSAFFEPDAAGNMARLFFSIPRARKVEFRREK